MHVLSASTVLGLIAPARGSDARAARSSMEREIVRFTAVLSEVRPEKDAGAVIDGSASARLLTAGLESLDQRCT